MNDLLNDQETQTTVDDILKDKLQGALGQLAYEVQVHEMAKIASEHSAIDLAYAASRIPLAASSVLFENLSDSEKIPFLMTIQPTVCAHVLRHLEDAAIVKFINQMPLEEAVWVLDNVSDRTFRRLSKLLDLEKAQKILELRSKDQHSAQRIMLNDFFAFSMDTTLGEVAEYIHEHPHIEMTRRIFVLNEKGQLQGYVLDRNLIVNPPSLSLKQVMRSISHKVGPEASREEVVDLVERYKIPALPVVDEENRLMGVICYEDVVEALEDIADETLAHVGGTNEQIGEYEPIHRKFLARAPWLLVTLVAGLVNAFCMALFESQEGMLLAFVLFFVPLITGMSGNIGIQCSTVLVRGMATGLFSAKGKKEVVLHELALGLCTGLLFGALTGILVYFLKIPSFSTITIHPLIIGTIVSAGLIGACCVGTLLGVFSPLFFMRIGVDPAVASGPIVTAFNDFFSMMIYFLISWGLGSIFFAI